MKGNTKRDDSLDLEERKRKEDKLEIEDESRGEETVSPP